VSRLLLLSGIPASGKSTLARKLVDDYGNLVRVNRDSLRGLFFNGKWTGPREKFIKYAERQIAKAALDFGYSVCVDDTSLLPRDRASWEQLAKDSGASFEFRALDTSLEECLRRDAVRGSKRVGPAVIYRMAVRAGLFKFEPADWPIVLCDLDGTLCQIDHRLRYIKNCKHCGRTREQHDSLPDGAFNLGSGACVTFAKDWQQFHFWCKCDTPRSGVVKWVRELYKDHIVILTSGRSDEAQFDTVDWLAREKVPYHCLLMRSHHDYKPDMELKMEYLSWLPKHRIQFVIDDRKCVLDMWKAQGLKAYNVSGTDKEY
jgi:predicted kinase